MKARRSKKKALILVVAALFAFSVPLQALAAEEDKDALSPPETVKKEYRYQDGQEPPAIEESLVDNEGNRYRLVSVDGPVTDGSYWRPTQFYTHRIEMEVPLEGINSLADYFPSSIYIEDGIFVGNIGLVVDPYDEVSVYESITGQVDKDYTITDLPDNDVVRLPLQMDFEIRSDATPEATCTATLNLLSVQYEVAGTNSLGLPNNYTAYLTYRGQESWLELHHYQVTAYYAGEIASIINQYIATGHYELEPPAALPVAPAPAPAPAPTPIPSVSPALSPLEIPVATPTSMTPLYASTTLVTILAFGWLLLWLLFFRKNVLLVRMMDGSREVLLRKHVNVTAGEAAFEIPDTVNLYDRAQYVIELKPRLASQQGELIVTWRKGIVAREELKAVIQIDMNSIVFGAVTGAIIEGAPGLVALLETGGYDA
ncbi:MAG: hypothetical protein FWF91_06335 [Coriobacteriia bacterium]|nr:hypothetical protein [Coriobacteriia bacterium]